MSCGTTSHPLARASSAHPSILHMPKVRPKFQHLCKCGGEPSLSLAHHSRQHTSKPNIFMGAGVLGFDASGGFLLLHSTPKFPDSPADAAYGGIYTSQLQHAQAFTCVSLAPAAVDQLAHLLQTTNLYIYSQQLPAGIAQAYANVSLLLSQALPFEGATLDPKTKRLATNLATAGRQQAV